MLPDFLNYQVTGQIRSDHRETLRGSGPPTLTEGFSGIRNRDVFILNDGTDATADGALQIP